MMRPVLLLSVSLPLVLFGGCGEKSSSDVSESLSDADVVLLLKEAVDFDSLEERDGRGQRGSRLRAGRFYQTNESEPYSGWVKEMWDSGQVQGLGQAKDGKEVGLFTYWHENGQKAEEVSYKDGEPLSVKYWNSKGEEVDSQLEVLE